MKESGVFFAKAKDASIWSIFYAKTNYLRAMKPEPMLSTFDPMTKEFKTKRHSPNKIWFASFDKDGRDYVSMKDITAKEFDKTLSAYTHVWDLEDHSPEELYDAVKETGPTYTKKWFKNSFAFMKGQLDKMREHK